MVRVREPAPDALARVTLLPATRASESAVPAMLVPPPEIEFVPAAPADGVGPTMVMELSPVLRVIFAPATRETLDEVPLSKKLVAAGTFGPPIEITPAPFDEMVILFPPEMVIGPELNDPVGPMLTTFDPVVEMVIELDEELNPIPVPATSETLLDEALRLKFVATGRPVTEMVMVEELEENPILVPATKLTLDDEPFKEKLVAAGTLAEIVSELLEPDRVMLEPANRVRVPEEIDEVTPDVAPPTAEVITITL